MSFRVPFNRIYKTTLVLKITLLLQQDPSGVEIWQGFHYISQHGSRDCSSMSSRIQELLIMNSIILKDDMEVGTAQ
jgi:hypothetical protein